MEIIEKITNAKAKNAYGLYLTIPNNFFEEFRTKVADAENITDVLVDVGGVKKEFTGDEFLIRLGFK